ncbi:MAG: hypothetical protein QMC77_06100 [Methanocellales archaeon]|nr:hypothetical protein [Methanocellales archaeon]
MEKVDAIIEDAKVCKISDLWRRKPRGLGFGDTDAVIVTAKTDDKTIRDTFYVRLKADGTFSTSALNKSSRSRQERLASFLKHYITKDIKDYNIKEGTGKWKGKSVKVVPYKDSGYIHVP